MVVKSHIDIDFRWLVILVEKVDLSGSGIQRLRDDQVKGFAELLLTGCIEIDPDTIKGLSEIPAYSNYEGFQCNTLFL